MDLIVSHVNVDFDALASMIAVRKLYPEAVMVFLGSQEKNIRDFFLLSTAYAFAFERLKNIDIDAVTRLILVDTRQKKRIGPFARLLEKKGVEIHIYDHHPTSPDDIKGNVELIREAGANITNICEIFQEKNLEITPDEATIMMLGIYEDTGSLTFSSTTVRDYQAAAYLLSRGANLNTVAHMITREMTVDQVSLLNDLIHNLRHYTIHGAEVAITSASVDKYIPDLAVLLHKLIEMKGLKVAVALVRMEDRIYLVMRSNLPEINAAEVATVFGGGGHPSAASATIKELTLAQAREELLSILNQKVRVAPRAVDLMSSPVKTVGVQNSIKSAAETLTQYNINAMPVVQGHKLVGLITRQIIEKAIYHGLDNLQVGEYMISDFVTVNPSTPFAEVQALIIENKQRFLPVVEGGGLVGCITRTDLLTYLYEQQMEIPESPPDAFPVSPYVKNVVHIMKERLPLKLYQLLSEMGRTADDMGINAYAVGGFVRDLFLNQPNWDIDIVVEGDGIAYATEFARRRKCRVKTHKTFATAQISVSRTTKVDVATARLEYYESPAAQPIIERSSIKLDLYRRDFTINALALCINQEKFGQLLDHFGGLRDIKDKTIRVLHNLSFVEDPIRILRALRFAHRFDFQIGKHTEKLIGNAVKLNLFPRLEGARVLSELKLIMEEKNPGVILSEMNNLKILHGIYTHLHLGAEQVQIFARLEEVLSWYILLYREERVVRWLTYFLALTDSLTKKRLNELCVRLGMNEKATEFFLSSKETAPRVIRRLDTLRRRPNSEVYSILQDVPLELSLFIMAKSPKEALRKAISLYVTHLKDIQPLVNGKDLKKLGFAPGPLYREILGDLKKARLNGEVSSKNDELQYIENHYRG